MASKTANRPTVQSLTNIKNLRLILIALATGGLAVAGYLTFTGFTGSNLLCAPGGGCEVVQNSIYSKVGGIPVALFGLIGYLGIFSVLILESRSSFFEENGHLLIFGMSLIGFIYSMYLMYISKARIGEFCPWCVVSATLMTVIFGLSVYRTIRRL